MKELIIERLQSVTEKQAEDILLLIKELSSDVYVDITMLRRVVSSPSSYLFAMTEDDGRIIGTATLCIFESPTGRKAHIEDVVVLSSFRGQHLGKMLMEFVIDFARQEFGQVDLYLTSRPHRIAANKLYQSVGFQQKETNVYKMKIGGCSV